MRGLYLASVALHVLAVAVWIGGMVALAVVIVPVLRGGDDRARAIRFLRDSGLRLRPVTWAALVVLVLTGAFQAVYRVGAATLLEPAFWSGAWGRLLALKLALVALILCLAAVHDFRIGPAATADPDADSDTPDVARLRQAAAGIGRTNLLLSLAALVLGVLLARGG